ncbi:TspO/MBR family protein [Methanolobus sp. ZRKC3]|uniref:TspO/MBR family protein n=1 Tax=Methanolobus sp. ZRKC3 TaxID=3125786 RepID=UPI00324A5CCB
MNSTELNTYFNNIDWKKLVVSILICNVAGLAGLFFTMPLVFGWYESLVRPSFVPPNEVFGTAWSVLYILMGISLYLVWEKGWSERKVKVAMGFFGIQLFLNFLWPVLFFGMQSLVLGLVDVILLWFAILVTIRYFYAISKKAALLLVPYIMWVSFAVIMNYYFVILNP